MYILASGSPRRRELMNLITKDFISEVSGCDEFVPEGTPPEQIPAILAEQKAQAVAKNHPDDIVIGSDTIVVLDGRVFGKPKTSSVFFFYRIFYFFVGSGAVFLKKKHAGGCRFNAAHPFRKDPYRIYRRCRG